MSGNLKAVKSLISKGADVNKKAITGLTPLLFAVEGGNLEVVKVLLDAGANVNATPRYGGSLNKTKNNRHDSPLNEAVEKGHLGIIKVLIEAGADVNAKGARHLYYRAGRDAPGNAVGRN